MKKDSLEAQSLVQNFMAFVKPLSDQEVSDLHLFLTETFNDKTPTDLQKNFIDEFIGFTEWGEFIIDYRVHLKSSGFFRPLGIIENVTNLRNFLGVDLAMRFQKHLKRKFYTDIKNKEVKLKSELKLVNLKIDLAQAIQDSYDDGVFDKCDGWCNVADVLLAHKLIKPFK